MGTFDFFRTAVPEAPAALSVQDLQQAFYERETGQKGPLGDIRRAFLLDRLGLASSTLSVHDLEQMYYNAIGAGNAAGFFKGNPVKRINESRNPRGASVTDWTFAVGTGEVVATSAQLVLGDGPPGCDTFFRTSVTTAKTGGVSGIWHLVQNYPGKAGQRVFSSIWVRFSHAVTINPVIHAQLGTTIVTLVTGAAVDIPAYTWTRVAVDMVPAGDYDNIVVYPMVSASSIIPAGGFYDASLVMVEKQLGYGPIVRRNLLKNPSAEVDTSTWLAERGTVAISTLNPTSGTKSLEITATDASNSQYLISGATLADRAVVKGLKRVRASADVRLPIAGSVFLQLYEYDAAGTLLGTSDGAPEVFSADITQRISTVLPLRATTETVRTVVFTPTLALNAKYYVDSLVLEDADTAAASSSYFDGRSVGAEWEGTPDASTSILRQYLSDPSKITRYFDGNSPGARWEGAVDASRSIMDFDWEAA